MRNLVILTLHRIIAMVIRLRRMRYKDNIARITLRNSVRASEEKKTFLRPKRRWKDSIKTDLKEVFRNSVSLSAGCLTEEGGAMKAFHMDHPTRQFVM